MVFINVSGLRRILNGLTPFGRPPLQPSQVGQTKTHLDKSYASILNKKKIHGIIDKLEKTGAGVRRPLSKSNIVRLLEDFL